MYLTPKKIDVYWQYTSEYFFSQSSIHWEVAFTPVQGLEIARPDATKRVADANKKYFGGGGASSGTFSQVGK